MSNELVSKTVDLSAAVADLNYSAERYEKAAQGHMRSIEGLQGEMERAYASAALANDKAKQCRLAATLLAQP